MKRQEFNPPVLFALSLVEAAAAIGVSPTTFLKLVAEGKMPKPTLIGRRKVWDAEEVRLAFKALPRDGDEEPLDTWGDVA